MMYKMQVNSTTTLSHRHPQNTMIPLTANHASPRVDCTFVAQMQEARTHFQLATGTAAAPHNKPGSMQRMLSLTAVTQNTGKKTQDSELHNANSNLSYVHF